MGKKKKSLFATHTHNYAHTNTHTHTMNRVNAEERTGAQCIMGTQCINKLKQKQTTIRFQEKWKKEKKLCNIGLVIHQPEKILRD